MDPIFYLILQISNKLSPPFSKQTLIDNMMTLRNDFLYTNLSKNNGNRNGKYVFVVDVHGPWLTAYQLCLRNSKDCRIIIGEHNIQV